MTFIRTSWRASRWWPGNACGLLCGGAITLQFSHVTAALAVSLKATTQTGRVSAVCVGVIVLILLMLSFRAAFGESFYHGFMVATGLFLSFDIVVFHWVFQLHRITNGPEADVLEPLFVVLGAGLTMFGIRRERLRAALNPGPD